MAAQASHEEEQALLESQVVEGYGSTTTPAPSRSSLSEETLHVNPEGQYDDAVDDNPKAGLFEARARLKYTFPAFGIGVFLSAADQTVIASSYGQIGTDLSGLDKVSWLVTAYLITTTAFQPLYGKLSDVVGRKACLLFAYSTFGLGALLCGLARDIDELIAARAFAGIGAGGITTVVSILLSDMVPLEERGLWQGYVNMVFACGAGLGAPLGGILTDTIGWRWAFIAQAPLCAIAILIVTMLLHVPTRAAGVIRTNLSRVDFLGAALLISALTTLLLFLDGVSAFPDHWTTYAWLAASAFLFPLFLSIESRVAKDPLTPIHLLFGQHYLGAYLGNAFAVAGWFGVMFYTPLLYQAVDGRSASEAGALLAPGIVSGIVGGLVGGVLMKRSLGFARLAQVSYLTVAVACGIMGLLAGSLSSTSTRAVELTTGALCASLFLGGLGNGGGMPASLVAVVTHASPEDQAIVTACSFLFRSMGIAVGLATLSLVFQRALTAALTARLAGLPGIDPEETLREVQASLRYIETLPPEAMAAVQTSYGFACQAVFFVSLGFAACGFVSAVFVKEKRAHSLGRDA